MTNFKNARIWGGPMVLLLSASMSFAQSETEVEVETVTLESEPEELSGRAPGEPVREGFFFRVGIGPSWMSNTTSSDVPVFNQAFDGWGINSQIMLGGAVAEGLAIGGAYLEGLAIGGSYDDSGPSGNFSAYFQMIGPFLSFYPMEDSGLHFEFVPGVTLFQVGSSFPYGNTDTVVVGWGLAGSVGYDWWISEQWAIGIAGQFQYGMLAKDGITNNIIVPGALLTFTYF